MSLLQTPQQFRRTTSQRRHARMLLWPSRETGAMRTLQVIVVTILTKERICCAHFCLSMCVDQYLEHWLRYIQRQIGRRGSFEAKPPLRPSLVLPSKDISGQSPPFVQT